jgi:hypothetical protein
VRSDHRFLGFLGFLAEVENISLEYGNVRYSYKEQQQPGN